MKKRHMFYGGMVVALAGIILTGAAYGYHHFYSPEERIAHLTDKIVRELELDEPQQQLLQEIAAAFKEKIVELHTGREQAHRQVIALVGQERITEEDVAALMAQHREKFDRMAAFAASQFVRFHAALSDEQRGLLVQAMEKHASSRRGCRLWREAR